MNEDVFNARWKAGDGTPLSDFVLTMFKYANRITDVAVVQMYLDRLKHLPLKEVEAVWTSLLPATGKPIVPTIENILTEHRRRAKDRDEKREIKTAKPAPKPGEYDRMKRAAMQAYGHRINSGAKHTLEFPVEYHGDFDYQTLVDSLPIPAPDEQGHAAHRPYWDRLFAQLQTAWGNQ